MSQVRKDVLNGWKEIAAYLGRDPRTVERWEKTRSLPVRRMPGSGRSTVYALTSELDQWLTQPAISTSTEVNPPSLPQQDTMDVQVATPSVPQAPGQHGSEDLALAATVADLSRSPMTWIALPILLVVLVLASVGLHAWRAQRHTRPVSRDTQILPVAHPSKVAGVEDLYLRGWYQMELRTPESLAHAQDAFQEANKRDPRYAPALAGLACTYLLVREYTTVPEDEAYRMASDAATRAVALDPDLPQAHAALGFVEFFWKWNAAQAEREFELALRLDPKLALAHHWYGSMLTHQGRFSEALDQLGIAQHLDPGSAAILTTRALALGLSGHKAESSVLLNEAIAVEAGGAYRNPATMHQVMGTLSLLDPRDVPRFLAENMLSAALRRDDASVRQWRAATKTFQDQGERAMWRQLLAMEQQKSGKAVPTYALARYQAELGARQEALSTLEVLLARHDPAMIGIAIDPLLNGCRNDRRFGRLLSVVGLRAS